MGKGRKIMKEILVKLKHNWNPVDLYSPVYDMERRLFSGVRSGAENKPICPLSRVELSGIKEK